MTARKPTTSSHNSTVGARALIIENPTAALYDRRESIKNNNNNNNKRRFQNEQPLVGAERNDRLFQEGVGEEEQEDEKKENRTARDNRLFRTLCLFVRREVRSENKLLWVLGIGLCHFNAVGGTQCCTPPMDGSFRRAWKRHPEHRPY